MKKDERIKKNLSTSFLPPLGNSMIQSRDNSLTPQAKDLTLPYKKSFATININKSGTASPARNGSGN